MKKRIKLKGWVWLVIGFMLGMIYYNLFIEEPETIIVAVEKETVSEEQIEVCEYDEVTCLIKEVAESYEMDWKIAVAISKHETGVYTSKAFKEYNNVGGMMCNSGLIKYDTLYEGISAFVKNLKENYIDIGLTTLELIQPKYCPIGASNDPKGLNKYWLSGTTKYYNELEGE